MDQKEENYGSSFPPLDYSLDHHHHHHQQQQQQHEHEADIMKPPRLAETSGDNNNNNNNHHGMMIDYMLNNPHHHQQQQQQQQHVPNSFDKLCFADVMQFADFGPKLSLNQTRIPEEDESGLDPVYFLKFPVLNEKLDNHNHNQTHSHSYNHPQSFMVPVQHGAISISNEESFENNNNGGEQNDEEQARVSVSASENNDMSVQLRFMGEEMQQNRKSGVGGEGVKTNKRKRTRSVKTSEEVESQRMTHIAVERNRRKQMNEHLRVLRSLMPGSYVQRGDQASIIGGAIEFVRELEQLLQCLESQKRRRLLGESPGNGGRQLAGDSSTLAIQPPPPPPQAPLFPPAIPPPLPFPNVDLETGGLREETAENKSCLADVEVKVLGFDAMIKILSRRRPGQLIKAIAALEDLQLNILHTNITTIEQTVLYSFNVKVANESRFSAEDIANSVQQIFTFIHGSSSI